LPYLNYYFLYKFITLLYNDKSIKKYFFKMSIKKIFIIFFINVNFEFILKKICIIFIINVNSDYYLKKKNNNN